MKICIMIKIPNIYKLNKNTTLKIDDITWDLQTVESGVKSKRTQTICTTQIGKNMWVTQ